MDHRQLAPYILGRAGTIVTLTFLTKVPTPQSAHERDFRIFKF